MEISKTAVGVLAALCIAGGRRRRLSRDPQRRPVAGERRHRGAARQPGSVGVGRRRVGGDRRRRHARHRSRRAPRRRRRRAAPARTAPARPVAPRERQPNRVAPRVRSSRPQFDTAARAGSDADLRAAHRDAAGARPGAAARARAGTRAVRAVEPPQPEFEELIVSADSVVGLQVETSITSERARVEDEVVARVTRDVRVGDRVAIPAGLEGARRGHARRARRPAAGARAPRHPVHVGRARRRHADPARDRHDLSRRRRAESARARRRLAAARLAAPSSAASSAARRARMIGGSAGAGAGTAAVLAGGRNPATLPTGTPVTVRVTKPATVTVEK